MADAPTTTTPTLLGTYTFGPTLTADGTVQQSRSTTTRTIASSFSQGMGDVHFVYYQQEIGAFIQDQFKLNSRFSITPGIRYDWQNFLADRRLGFAPRVSFAWVIDEQSKTVVRGGGGIYYDRFGSGPLLDLARYEDARRRSVQISLDPGELAGNRLRSRYKLHGNHRAATKSGKARSPRRASLPDPVRPLY